MATCQGRGGGALLLSWGRPGARGAPGAASALRGAPGLPSGAPPAGAGGSRRRLPGRAPLRGVGDVSPSFPRGSPEPPGPQRGPSAPRQPRGWAPAPGASAGHARRQARPRGRGRRVSVGPRRAPGREPPPKGFGPKQNKTQKKHPLTTKASLFLKAPLARIQEVRGAGARSAAAAAPARPSRGPALGHAGARATAARAAPRLSLAPPSASRRRHDPTGRGARARGPRGVSPGRAPSSLGAPGSRRAAPPHLPGPGSARSSRRSLGRGTSGCRAEREPPATAEAGPSVQRGRGRPWRLCGARRLGSTLQPRRRSPVARAGARRASLPVGAGAVGPWGRGGSPGSCPARASCAHPRPRPRRLPAPAASASARVQRL